MKHLYRVYVILFIALLTIGGTLVLVLPQNEFSENENRVLTELPAPGIDSYFSGDFQDQFESAVSDQFPLRDIWTGLSTGIRRLMGLHDAGGVYLGEDHYYIEKKLNKDVSLSQYKKNIAILKKFIGAHPNTQVLLVPSPATVLPEKLPAFAAVYDFESMFQIAKQMLGDAFIDVRPELQDAARDTQVYYRTDHHWTADGAYAAFRAWSMRNGRSEDEIPIFTYETAATDFLGTTYSKALDTGPISDTIKLPEIQTNLVFVTVNGKTEGEVYDREKLATKDKYAVFFGGNYAELQIDRPTSSSDREIVIFKDSYANCFTPMLIQEYARITLIDLRYETRPIRTVMEEHPNAECLVLYELSTFAASSEVARMGL